MKDSVPDNPFAGSREMSQFYVAESKFDRLKSIPRASIHRPKAAAKRSL